MGSTTTEIARRDRHPEVLTTEECAELLRVTPSTLYGWRYHGKGPRGHRIGKELRFLRADVLAWLEEQ